MVEIVIVDSECKGCAHCQSLNLTAQFLGLHPNITEKSDYRSHHSKERRDRLASHIRRNGRFLLGLRQELQENEVT